MRVDEFSVDEALIIKEALELYKKRKRIRIDYFGDNNTYKEEYNKASQLYREFDEWLTDNWLKCLQNGL